MDLPNYFLADLPPDAALSATMIAECCRTLRRNREHYLAHRSTQSMVNLLSGVGRNWLEPQNPLRKLALEQGPAALGFSQPTLAAGLDAFFKQLTAENLEALVAQDLGHNHRLDRLCSTEGEQKCGRAAIASAPELLVHITAGNLPNPALVSIVLGVLVRSAQFVKCASGTSLLPRLFAHSLYEAEPKLGACLEIAEWRGGNAEVESALFEEGDCVTATGTDETLAELGRRLPAKTRFLGYGHRLSFGFVASDALSGGNARVTAERAASDVAAWDQLGCLSPHAFYIQNGMVSAEKFAELLADSLSDLEQTQPRGELSAESAAAIASRRAIYELRAAHSAETRLWNSRGSTAWTVVYEADPRFQLSCLNRFVYVKPAEHLAEALQNAESVRGKVSTVGLAAAEHTHEELARELARWGATRVCPLGQMQNPPLCWRHDGRAALGELVRWTDWEKRMQ